MVLLQLGQEIQSSANVDLTSSSPESGESSLSNVNSLNEVINEWKRELEEKNFLLHEKNSLINSLENQLNAKRKEIFITYERCETLELDRDKNYRMVNEHSKFSQYEKRNSYTFSIFKFLTNFILSDVASSHVHLEATNIFFSS